MSRSFKSGNRRIVAGADLYCQDETSDEFYTLLDGWVYLYRIPADGRRQILDFSLPGGFLGFQPELSAPSSHSALGLTTVHVNRTLRALREADLQAMRGRTLSVINAPALAEMAGFDPDVVLSREAD
jgi:CRP-like cAMP-binding protein